MDNQGGHGPAGNNNRLFLNFEDDARFTTHDPRMYPTTPSTFPNPIFPQGQIQSGQSGIPQQQQYGNGYATHGPERNGQLPPSNYFQQSATAHQHVAQGQNFYPRSSPQMNEATSGMVNQFSNQNLGGRGAPYSPLQPSASQGFRTAGVPGQQQQQNYSHLTAPLSKASQQGVPNFEPAPRRAPEEFSESVHNNQKQCAQLSADFFRDSVQRARERNLRQQTIEQRFADPNASPAAKEQSWIQNGKGEGKYLRFLRTKDVPENYTTIKIIGKGAYGEVKLVQRKADSKIYALKSLIKTDMLMREQLAHVRAERDILAECDSPWIVRLYTTFQDRNFLFMLMEFLPGGDLMTMLIKYEIFSEDITRFYMAEIVLAIEAVHKLGFIHRDIKPDNILLDRGGHVKLTDFGLSTGFRKAHDSSYYQQLLQPKAHKPSNRNSVNLDQINLTVSNRSIINDWRKSRRVMAYSTVGTPDYIAPELFSAHGYSFECDWWSLGTIMFECQVGWPPFCAEDRDATYLKIVNWRQTLWFPDDIQLGADAENLIRSLICNSENRLGRGSADEIKNHKFFRGVNFNNLRKINAPFEPKLQSNVDTAYFPVGEINQTDNATLLRRAAANNEAREDIPEMNLPFLGYTFKRFETNFH